MVTVSRLGIVPEEGIKAPFRVETDAPIILEGNQIIRGYQTVSGNRVLVKDQVDASENGLYNSLDGEWKRASDMDRPEDVQANMWMVSQETGVLYEIDIPPGTYWNPGATDINFTPASGLTIWGQIGGTLSDQTDLQAALDAKANLTYVDTQDGIIASALTSHTSDGTIHFTESSINHQSITGAGTNTHSQIDTAISNSVGHISDGTIHFTQASITLAQSQVTNLVADLALKAPLASPTFTGAVQIGVDGGGDSVLNFYDDTNNTVRSIFWDDSESAFFFEKDDGTFAQFGTGSGGGPDLLLGGM